MKILKQVSARDYSQFIADVPASRLGERDHTLTRAAEAANCSREVRAIERDFDKLEPGIPEPWDEALSREVLGVRLDPTLGSEIKKTRS